MTAMTPTDLKVSRRTPAPAAKMTMTDFAALLTLSGLSQPEAAAYLGVKLQQVKDMASGRRSTPPGVISEMISLINEQERAASARMHGAAPIRLPPGAERACRGRLLVMAEMIVCGPGRGT